MKKILENLNYRKSLGKKSVAVLLDPDKFNFQETNSFCNAILNNGVNFVFVGGSLISSNNLSKLINVLKERLELPIVLFPGNSMHIDNEADALLLLSLISGRNPEFLIGQHVVAAPRLKRSNLELLPTGYMLVESGKQTTVSYISNTTPLPNDKPDVAACTAMAGEMLGLKTIYLDAGSGAQTPVPAPIITAVRNAVELPIIVGGGINTKEKAQSAFESGADLIVIGNVLEKTPEFINEMGEIIASYNYTIA